MRMRRLHYTKEKDESLQRGGISVSSDSILHFYNFICVYLRKKFERAGLGGVDGDAS